MELNINSPARTEKIQEKCLSDDFELPDGVNKEKVLDAGSDLFRAEAMEAQLSRVGKPIGSMPLSWRVFTLILMLIPAILVSLLFTGSYSRKETVRGVLRASGNEVRIYPTTLGIIRGVHVHEGLEVKVGVPIIDIATANTIQSGDHLNSVRLESLKRQAASIESQIQTTYELKRQEDNAGLADVKSINLDLELAELALTGAFDRQVLAEDRLIAGRKLKEGGFIIDEEIRRREDILITAKFNTSQAQTNIDRLKEQLKSIEIRRKENLLKSMQQIEVLSAQLEALTLATEQVREQSGYTLLAPKAGTVSGLQATDGQVADPRLPLLTIVSSPKNLDAEIYVPSRAAGFIAVGQRVRLQYDAFPYQHFGAAWGTVSEISATVISPAEMQVPVRIDEPVYRVRGHPDQESVRAFGRQHLLRSGMTLTGVIVLEPRAFWQWLLEPIIATRGRG